MDPKEPSQPQDVIKSDSETIFWWRLQEITLFLFVFLLVMSVIWDWWLLIPAFFFLGFNLSSNMHRIEALKKMIQKTGM
ncbi:MAG: hypothetical protein ABH883_07835 [Candidatus Omnitrophota bacterium]